ncbi:MAG TPA: prephenate dehydratase [Micromonosporaceae bacterium]|nr:prephenate dehydratase [Micromonosporaceae bacterium]
MSTRFVYLGPEATFAEQALRSLHEAEHGVRTPARSVAEALDAVRAGDADAALVPLENSVGGQVGVTLDELISGAPMMIIREVVLPVRFVLAARADRELATIATIAAHPQASTQCRAWLRAKLPAATVVDVLSNGAAAVGAAEGAYDAAVCAPIGASRYGLTVLADDIGDRPDAMTRFVLVARPGQPPPRTGDDVTTLAVSIEHDRVGALLAVLTELAVRGVNLTRIESRPTGEQLGRYTFFLDCAGHVAEARLGEALQGLRRVCADVRFLGSYPRAGVSGSAPAAGEARQPSGLSDAEFADAAAWLTELRAGRLG